MQRWCVCGCVPDIAAFISMFVLLLALHTTDSADEETYKSPSPSSRHRRAPGWGKRSGAALLGGEEEDDVFEGVNSPQSLLKRAPGWGKRAPGWGKRSSSFDDLDMDLNKRAPGWGKRAPGWGKRAPGWGKRSSLSSSSSPSSGYISPEGLDLMVKRGWGKRSHVLDGDFDVKRAPGWGKRSMKRAPGWGKRSSELGYCDSLSRKVDDYISMAIEMDAQLLSECGSKDPSSISRK